MKNNIDDIKEKRQIIWELKKLQINDKETRKKIITLFDENQADIKVEKNKIDVLNTLMHPNSKIRKILVNNLWAPDNILEKLNIDLLNYEFFDANWVFKYINTFLNANFKYLDLVVYRYNKEKDTLDFFSWNEMLASNISFQDTLENDFQNEINAFNSEKWEFFITFWKTQNQNFYWWIWWVKVEDEENTYILSFNIKNELYDFNSNMIDNEVLKIKKIFERNGLLVVLKKTLKHIYVKYRDDLTWAFNKNYINSLPKNTRYSVLFIDIDNFKNINDTYWHQSWDIVLREITNLFTKNLRPREKVCRISWDEFVILVPSNNPNEIKWIQNRLQILLWEKIFSFQNLKTKKQDTFSIKASIWTSWLNNSQQNLIELINQADTDMYKQKTWYGQISRIINTIQDLWMDEKVKIILEWKLCDMKCTHREDNIEKT